MAVVGSPGSGKTTLARALAAHRGLDHIELDSLFHQPGWVPLERQEFRRRVQARVDAAAAARGWVADGNYNDHLGDVTQSAADTIVWLDLPRPVVMRRVVGRTVRRLVTREELWNGNREPLTGLVRWDPEKSIVRWAWVHHSRYRERYEARSSDGSWSHAAVVRLRRPDEVDDWLESATGT